MVTKQGLQPDGSGNQLGLTLEEQKKIDALHLPDGVAHTQEEAEKALEDLFRIRAFDENTPLTMNAVISDVARVYEDEAEHEGDEAMRKEYEDIGPLKWSPSTWKVIDRMGLYLFREERKGKVANSYLAERETEGVDLSRAELTAAADRHERMRDEWNVFTDDHEKVSILLANVENAEIDELSRAYLNHPTGMSDREFEDQFQQIVARDKKFGKLVGKKLKHTASNILLKLRTERGYRNMIRGLLQAVETYAANPDKASAEGVYQTAAKKLIGEYTTLSQKGLPPNLQQALQTPGKNVEHYRKRLRHEVGIAKMQANTLKMKIDVLENGKGAYEVNNRDKEKMTWNPTTRFAALGKKLDKYPKTALTLSIGSTLALGLFNPAAAGFLAATKGVAWMAAKKAAHYTKEQKGQEKKTVRGLDAETNRLTNLSHVVKNAKRWQKIALGTNTYKGVRQGQLYANTTQYTLMTDAKQSVSTLQNAILSLDMDAIKSNAADALARLDYYAYTGHNFLGQQDSKDMEQTINTLQKLVQAAAETLDMPLADIRKIPAYSTLSARLDDGYAEHLKKFKKQRGILTLKYGAAAAAFSMGLRALFWSDDVGLGHNHGADATPAPGGNVPGTVPADPGVNPSVPTDPHYVGPTHVGPDPRHLVDHDAFNQMHHAQVTPGLYGFDPETVLQHVSNVDFFDGEASRKVIEQMVAAGECAPNDGPFITNALRAMKNALDAGESLHSEMSPVMQEKVARYLYHFAERDAVLCQITDHLPPEAIADATPEARHSWIWSFLHGGETFVKYAGNIIAASSPLFANTFIENVDVQLNDKKSGSDATKPPRDTGKQSPLDVAAARMNTVVDPNAPKVPYTFEDVPTDDRIIKPTTPTPAPTPTPTPTPTPDPAPNADDNPILDESAEERAKLIAFGKKHLKFDGESDGDFEKRINGKNGEELLRKIKVIMKVFEEVGEGKMVQLAASLDKQYEEFQKEILALPKFGTNGLARAYRDIAKQYRYFTDQSSWEDQNIRGYRVANPLTDTEKQKEIVDRMCGWHLYGDYRNISMHPQGKTEYDNLFSLRLPPAIFTQVKALLEKSPTEGRLGTPAAPDELSSKDLATLGALVNDNWIKISPQDPALTPNTDLTPDADAEDSDVQVAGEKVKTPRQAVSFIKKLFEDKASYNVNDFVQKIRQNFADSTVARSPLGKLMTDHTFGNFTIERGGDEAAADESLLQFHPEKNKVFIQPDKFDSLVRDGGRDISMILSAFAHELLHKVLYDSTDDKYKNDAEYKNTIDAATKNFLDTMGTLPSSSDERLEAIKETLKTVGKTKDYPMVTTHEILTYGLTDKDFLTYIQESDAWKNAFEELLALMDIPGQNKVLSYYNRVRA